MERYEDDLISKYVSAMQKAENETKEKENAKKCVNRDSKHRKETAKRKKQRKFKKQFKK